MARKWLRRGLIFGAILLGLGVVLAVVLPLVIPADRLRDLAEERLAAATGAEVSLGEASVRVWPRLAVVVADGQMVGTGAALAEATGAANSLEHYRVALKRLEVSVALKPLLRKQIEIGRVRLVAPEIECVTRPAAESAAATAPESEPGSDGRVVGENTTPSATDADLAWGLVVAGIEIQDGRLLWVEADSQRRVAVTGWQQSLTGVDIGVLIARLQHLLVPAGDPVVAEGAATAASTESDRPIAMGIAARCEQIELKGILPGAPRTLRDLRLGATLAIPAAGDRLQIGVTELAFEALTATAAVTIPVAGSGQPLHIEVEIAPLAVSDLLAQALALAPPQDDPALSQWLSGDALREGQLSLKLSGDLPWPLPAGPTAVAELVPLLDVVALLEGVRLVLPGTAGQVSGDLSAALRDGQLVIEPLVIRHDGGAFRAEGSLTMADVPGLVTEAMAAAQEPGGGAGQSGMQGGATTVRLRGELDLAAAMTCVGDVMAGLGRPAAADSLPELTGQVSWQADLRASRVAALADTRAWQRLGAGDAGLEVVARATAKKVGVTGGVPAAPWIFQTAELDLQPGRLELRAGGLAHPAAAGDMQLVAKLGAATKTPPLVLGLELESLDLDQLVAAMAPSAGQKQAAAGGASRDRAQSHRVQSDRAQRLIRYLEGFVAAAHAQSGPAGAAAAALPPGALIPSDLAVDFSARVERLILQKAVYTAAEAQGILRERVVTVPRIAARRSTGAITGRAVIDYNADPYGRLTFAAQLRDVPTEALLEPYAPALAPFWDGTASARLEGGCRLESGDVALATLDLTGVLNSSDGVYHAQELLAGVAPYLGARQDLQDVRFKRLVKKFKVRQGRLIIDSLRVDGLDTDWSGSGWVSFDGKIDMDLAVKLPPGFTPDLGDLSFLAAGLKGDDGRIELDLRITGRSARPTVALDLSGAKKASEEAIEEKLKKGLGGLLDKLKGR